MNITDGTYGDLIVKDNRITRGRKDLFRIVGSLALLDVAARQSTNPATHAYLDGLVRAIGANSLSLRYIDGINGFFNGEDRFKEFVETGNSSGLKVPADSQDIVAKYKLLHDYFVKEFTPPPPPPPPPYVFTEVPEGVAPLANFTIGRTRIRRGSYTVGAKMAKDIVEKAINKWRLGKVGSIMRGRYFPGAGYNDVNVGKTGVKIGCQNITRYEIEALAKHWNIVSEEAAA